MIRFCVSGVLVIFMRLAFIPCDVAVAADENWQASLAKGIDQLNNQAVSEAEKHFRQAVKEVEFAHHTATEKAKCLNELANVLALENKTKAAADIYSQSLNVLKQAYGNNSEKLLPTLFALGSINESNGDHEAAMAYYKRAIVINERNYGTFSSFANQEEVVKQQQKLSLPGLGLQAGLDASKKLENLLPSYKQDMLKNEASDQDLISDFQSEITKSGNNSSGRIAVSASPMKQTDKSKRSGGI